MRNKVQTEDLVFWFTGGLGLIVFTYVGWDMLRASRELVFNLALLHIELPYRWILRPFFLLYIMFGLFVIGGFSVLLAFKHRLFSPPLVAVGSLLVSWYLALEFSIYRPPTPFILYLVGWPLLLGLVVTVGRIEQSVSPVAIAPPSERLLADWGFEFVTWRQLAKGMGIGGIAFGVTCGFVRLFLFLDGDTWSTGTDSSPFLQERLAGNLFYNAHFVETWGLTDDGFISRNYIIYPGNYTDVIPEGVYFLAPLLVLVLGGYIGYSTVTKARSQPTNRIVAASLALTLGYLLLSITGVLLSHMSTHFYYIPDLLSAILLTGVCYPLLAGGAGAVLRYGVERR